MVIIRKILHLKIALTMLSAIFIFSCSNAMKGDIVIEDSSKIPTITTMNHSITFNENGQRAYRFKTPLMEQYGMVTEPYTEFRKGIHIETYDSLMNIRSKLIADYAIYNESKKLWEAKGNVQGENVDGEKIFTEQIFWDELKDSVYSNVDTKIVRGEEISIGAGFKSDGELKNIEYWQSKGRMFFDTTKTEQDTTIIDTTLNNKKITK